MTEFINDRAVLARIEELTTEALALADQSDLFIVAAKLEDSLFAAKELLSGSA